MKRKTPAAQRPGAKSPESVYATPPSQLNAIPAGTATAAPPSIVPPGAQVPPSNNPPIPTVPAAQVQCAPSQAPSKGGPRESQPRPPAPLVPPAAHPAETPAQVQGPAIAEGAGGAAQNHQVVVNGQSHLTGSISSGRRSWVPFVALYACGMVVILFALIAYITLAIAQPDDITGETDVTNRSRALPTTQLPYAAKAERDVSKDELTTSTTTVDRLASTPSEEMPR
ncbi:uncharacterized protein LOC144123268 [Amblyomma americanum]